MMKIELQRWEIDLVLNALAKLPYEESGAVIRRIAEQVEPTITHCKDCVWFAPVESIPEAEKMDKKLHELFDGVLPAREGKCGVCRKIPFCGKIPLLTNENGFCHRAERREE